MAHKYCPECGTKSASLTSKFCSSCGSSLDGSSSVKKSISRTRASVDDEDDPDGSDVYEVPNIGKLKASILLDEDLGIGGSSFSFGANGLTPVPFKPSRR